MPYWRRSIFFSPFYIPKNLQGAFASTDFDPGQNPAGASQQLNFYENRKAYLQWRSDRPVTAY